jgi:hypothetical protein
MYRIHRIFYNIPQTVDLQDNDIVVYYKQIVNSSLQRPVRKRNNRPVLRDRVRSQHIGQLSNLPQRRETQAPNQHVLNNFTSFFFKLRRSTRSYSIECMSSPCPLKRYGKVSQQNVDTRVMSY